MVTNDSEFPEISRFDPVAQAIGLRLSYVKLFVLVLLLLIRNIIGYVNNIIIIIIIYI